MTALADGPLSRLERLDGLDPAQKLELYCQASPAVFAERKLGYRNADFHDEWYRLILQSTRLCLVAPRDHSKTEVVTVVQTSWRSIYRPGTWTYLFCNTGDQAKVIKERVDAAIESVAPRMITHARKHTDTDTRYANGSRLTVAGAGKSVRSAHPDIVIGDDILEEQATLTAYQRKKTERWWFGTVSNMAHPGTRRALGPERHVIMPPTRYYLVGTPFHAQDLLMKMRTNPLYRFVRYAAEYSEADRVDGTHAVEMA